jgi:radical SAM superfamily enzyme YgiQ (UPF0313 family)
LAATLRESGYDPCIIDGAIDSAYLQTIARQIEGAFCFGVSLLTGPMILDAIEASKLVRRVAPGLPIVYGGWHPSLLTAETLREEFVDVVVRHQGEKTLVELLERLAAGNPLDLLPGLWFKRSGRIHQNQDRPATPLSDLPGPAYDLVDWDAYERASGQRKLPYGTSIGCPYACNYCTDTVFYNRRFNPETVERVVREMTTLARDHRLSEIALIDSNFLVNVDRAIAIAQGILDSGASFRWTFQASTDLLCRMSDEEVKLLGRSGVSHIGFGTESASPEVLRKMQKGHQHIPDIYEAARKCSLAGIHVTLNLIFGYPGEEESHRRETLRVMSEIGERYGNVTFSPNIFTPYPGIPIWPELRELGLQEPKTLEEWASMDLGGTSLPWLAGESLERLERAVEYFLLDNRVSRVQRRLHSRALQVALTLARIPLRWRTRNYRYAWPVELWLAMARRWLVMRRSLITGQPLALRLAAPGLRKTA